jgi:AraC-like DNA-binding protein
MVDEMKIEGKEFLFILDSRHKADFVMNFHRHDFYELSFVIQGNGCCQIQEGDKTREITIQKDSLLLWDGRIPHRSVDNPEAPLEQLIIIFDEAYLEKLEDSQLVRAALEKKNPLHIANPLYTVPLKHSFREILKEIRSKETGGGSMVFSLLSRLLVQILRAEEGQLDLHCGDERINRVLDYIHHNFYKSISIQSAASLSALSLRQFSDVYKKETGRTFTRYLNGIRIEKAREALTESSLSITEIAFETGFDDLSYFTRRFKEQENISPRAYRKNFRK